MRFASRALGVGVLIVGSSAVGGCLVDDPNHCANKNGHASCTEDGFPFCSRCVKSTEHGGCVAEAPTEDKCELESGVSPGTAGSDSGTSPTDDGVAGTDAASTAGPVGCSAEGARDETCPEATPYCVAGTCAGCDAGGDEFCAGVDATSPVCGSAGVCVACSADDSGACGADEFCSPAGVCGGCTSHDQCAPAGCEGDPNTCQACNFESGKCLEGAVFWVSLDDCEGAEPAGTHDDPYCQISQAMANVGPSFETFTVWVSPSRTAYTGPVNLQTSGTHRVAVVGRGGRPTILGSTHAANLSTSANRLILSSLALQDGSLSTVRCASGRLWLDDVIVRGGPIGVSAENCTLLSVSRSVITGADELGISATGSGLRMVNSSVLNNGSDASPTSGGIFLTGQSDDWTIDYSTVVGNLRESPGGGNAITCAADSGGDARNSIFLSGEGTSAIDCAVGHFSYTVSDIVDLRGEGNVKTNYRPDDFDNVAVGDAHLHSSADPAIFEIAVWRDGDAPLDFDGDLRPLVDGAQDWAGFDRP